ATQGSMNATRTAHTATLLNNGRVIIVGGADSNYNPLSSVELYDSGIGVATAVTLTDVAKLPSGAFQFVFTNTPGVSFSILTTTNAVLPFNNWTYIARASEISPGHFQFIDPQAANSPTRFYLVRSP